MSIPVWGVARKHCWVVRPRVIVGQDLEAADRGQPAFALAFRRHSSAPRVGAARVSALAPR
jgi:hypothetical protein